MSEFFYLVPKRGLNCVMALNDCVMHGGLMIGYPAETYTRIPPRKNADVMIR